jgi:hypothetical protein
MSAAVAQPRLTDGAGAESVWRGCATAGGLLVEPVGWDEERIPTPRSLRLCGESHFTVWYSPQRRRVRRGARADACSSPRSLRLCGESNCILNEWLNILLCVSAVNRICVVIAIRILSARSQMRCATSV